MGRDNNQMLEGDMRGGSSPYAAPATAYHQGGERRKAKDDKDKDKKKPKVLVDYHLHGHDAHHFDPHHHSHVDELHHTPHLVPPPLPHHELIHKEAKDYDKAKFKPNKPVHGTLVHTGEMAYDPHHTPVHEVYRPKDLNNHNEEQIWVPHYSSHNQGLQTFEDNQHGQVVAFTPDQHIDDLHHQGDGFYNHGGEGVEETQNGFNYESHHQGLNVGHHYGGIALHF